MKSSLVMVFLFGLFSACGSRVETNQNIEISTAKINSTPVAFTTPAPETSSIDVRQLKTKLNSSIRKVDFENFTFPWTKEQGAPDLFTLKDGKKERIGDESGADLQPIEYGDVTNDNQEEAMISISPETGGNCQCYMVYIYTLKKGKPELLWNFDTWDRAEGGFKRAYAENGYLVVELFGEDKYENGKWHYDIAEGKFNGLCCPTTVTKFHFQWNGRKFVLAGKPEMFDYDWKKRTNGK